MVYLDQNSWMSRWHAPLLFPAPPSKRVVDPRFLIFLGFLYKLKAFEDSFPLSVLSVLYKFTASSSILLDNLLFMWEALRSCWRYYLKSMIYPRDILLLISFLSIHHTVSAHAVLTPRTLARRVPGPSPTANFKESPVTFSTQGYNISQPLSSVGSPKDQSMNQTNTITAAPSQTIPPEWSWCLIGNSLPCSNTRTWDGLPISSYSKQCMLWDSSCSGDRTAAINEFFGDTVWALEEKPCFVNTSLADCSKYESAQTLSEMGRIREWMRSPQCLSSSQEYNSIQGQSSVSPIGGDTCCGIAYIAAQNVDVYYWPEPNANTDCLSLVGTSVYPLDYGATTDSGEIFWGCTAKSPSSSVKTTISGQSVIITTYIQSFIRTAQITNIGTLSFKQPLINPWSPPPCIGQISAPASSNVSIEARGSHPSLHARGHSLIIPASLTQVDSLPVSTVVSGSFTL